MGSPCSSSLTVHKLWLIDREKKACRRATLSSGTTWVPSATPTTHIPLLNKVLIRLGTLAVWPHHVSWCSQPPPLFPPAPVTNLSSNYLTSQNMKPECSIKALTLNPLQIHSFALFVLVPCTEKLLITTINDLHYQAFGVNSCKTDPDVGD